jgi:O-antigen/teichoic acid export membrane protein
VLSFAYQVIIAGKLGPSGFGLLVLALAISKLLAEASDLGLDYGLLRLGGISYGQGDTGRFRAIVGRGIVGALVAGAVAGLALAAGASLVAELFHKSDLTIVLVPLALSVPFTGTTEVARAALRAMGDARRPVASSSIIAPSIRLITGIWAVSSSPSASAAAWAYLSTEALVALITTGMLWRQLPPAVHGDATAEGLFRFSLPMSLNRILLYSNNQTEIVLLGILTPSATVGIFGVARRLSVLVGALLTSVSTLFNPIVADLHHSGRTEELDQLFRTSTRWVVTVGLPLCLVEFLFAPEIVGIIGPDFARGAAPLMILSVGQLINLATGAGSNLQAMAGYAKITLLNSLLFLSTSIALDLALIPSFGLVGAAVANTTAVIVVNVLRVWQIHTKIGLMPYDRSFLRPFAAAIPAGIIAELLPLHQLPDEAALVVRVAALCVAYLIGLFLLGFEPVDREIARAAIARVRGRPVPSPATTGGSSS